MNFLAMICQDIIWEKYGTNSCNIGDDGGLAPNIYRQVWNNFVFSSFAFILILRLLS
jgi:hypothetical protein